MAPAKRHSRSRDTSTLSIWGAKVDRIESVEDLEPLDPNRNSSKACIAYSSSPSRTWIRKRRGDTGHPALLAEVVGWLLAKELKVPTPYGAVTGTGDDLSWLSEVVPHVHQWNAFRAKYVQNLDEFGRVLALDAIAYNPDRTERNILLKPTSRGHRLVAYSIDLGASLLGSPRELAAAGLTLPEVEALAERLPIDRLSEGALAAADAAQLLPKTRVAYMVNGACRVTGEREADILTDALFGRTQAARQLTEQYLAKIAKFQKVQ